MKVVNLVVEDRLSEAVLKRIMNDFKLYPGTSFGLQGNGYIKKRIHAFQQAARYTPYIVLTDLDDNPCPPQLIHSWLGAAIVEPKFLFRIAVREIETWLLADKPNITSYLGVSEHCIPNDVERQISNPKEFLIDLAKRSRKKDIKEDIAPSNRSSAKYGKNYNGALIKFVSQIWNYNTAKHHSPSLDSALGAISRFAANS
ncbi:MAG: hypothetical protein PHP45_06055 [Elusimicrobiales bacterium]|nr:hypothetical protein [Elusimicrobiales bacterium]